MCESDLRLVHFFRSLYSGVCACVCTCVCVCVCVCLCTYIYICMYLCLLPFIAIKRVYTFLDVMLPVLHARGTYMSAV